MLIFKTDENLNNVDAVDTVSAQDDTMSLRVWHLSMDKEKQTTKQNRPNSTKDIANSCFFW